MVAADRGAFPDSGDNSLQVLGPYDSITASVPDNAFYQMGDADGYFTVGFSNANVRGLRADSHGYCIKNQRKSALTFLN